MSEQIVFSEFPKIPQISVGAKKCRRCETEFPINRRAMKRIYCSAQCREKTWVEANREHLNENVRKYRARRYKLEGRWLDNSPKAVALNQWMIELKSKPCHDCGQKFPICCMDFDHRKGTKKTYNIGSMFAHHYSRELIETELAKCDLVCANCHRMRTRNRRTGSGKSTT